MKVLSRRPPVWIRNIFFVGWNPAGLVEKGNKTSDSLEILSKKTKYLVEPNIIYNRFSNIVGYGESPLLFFLNQILKYDIKIVMFYLGWSISNDKLINISFNRDIQMQVNTPF